MEILYALSYALSLIPWSFWQNDWFHMFTMRQRKSLLPKHDSKSAWLPWGKIQICRNLRVRRQPCPSQIVSSDSGLVSRGKEIALGCTDLCLNFLLLNFHYMRSTGPFVDLLEKWLDAVLWALRFPGYLHRRLLVTASIHHQLTFGRWFLAILVVWWPFLEGW